MQLSLRTDTHEKHEESCTPFIYMWDPKKSNSYKQRVESWQPEATDGERKVDGEKGDLG